MIENYLNYELNVRCKEVVWRKLNVRFEYVRYRESGGTIYNQNSALDTKFNPMNEWVYSDVKFKLLKMYENIKP